MEKIAFSAKKITSIDYQQQIIFLIGPTNHCYVLLIFLVAFFYVLDCWAKKKKKVWESLFKMKRIISKFYILFNDSRNVISKCRVTNCSPNPDRIGYGPNKPNTINLWESGWKNWVGDGLYNS